MTKINIWKAIDQRMSNEHNGDRQIKPFICSTDDFGEERQFLAANIFPKLQSKCRQRAVYFQPYDWDHGLSDDRLNQGLTLQLALKCISYASPFFIGFLGSQYGHHRVEGSNPLPADLNSLSPDAHWIDKCMMVAATHGYKWLLDQSYACTSLTELKIIQAAFLSNETKFCKFYIRDQVASARALTETTRYDKFKLQQLKGNIAKRGLYVSYYNSLEHLGELVMSDWTAVIDQLFPPFYTYTTALELQVDGIHHKAFGKKRCEHFIVHEGVANCLHQLTAFCSSTNDYSHDPFIRAKQFEKSTGVRLLRKGRQLSCTQTGEHKSIFVLTGPRGCGKTSLVSSWLQNNAAGVLPTGTTVIYHYATCSRMARNIAVFMKRCITELRLAFDAKYVDFASMESEEAQFSQIRETFLATIALGPCVLVFDGLDEMAAAMGNSMKEIKQMNWLPSPLPPTCKFIFTATDSDLTVRSLHKRNDVLFCAVVPIESNESKMDILREYLSSTANEETMELSAASQSQITQYKRSSSPLYLNIIANELCDMNVSCDISTHLDVYANLDSITNSTRDMWTSLVKRWVRDYSWTRYREDAGPEALSNRLEDTVICGWVPDCLRLLACSRDGLTVNEILGTLSFGMGYRGDSAVTTYDWYLFYDAAKPALYEKPNGLIIISHEHLVEVIDFLLLGNISPPSQHEPNVDLQHLQRYGGMERRQYHTSLASHLLSKSADEQLVRIEEILWQLEASGDYTRLFNMLFIPLVVDKMYGSIYSTYNPLRIELYRFCHLLKEKKIDIGGKIVKQLAKLGVLESPQHTTAVIEAGELSIAEPQSAAFSQLSQSELGHQVFRPVARYGLSAVVDGSAGNVGSTDSQSEMSGSANDGLDFPSRDMTEATQSRASHFSTVASQQGQLQSINPSTSGNFSRTGNLPKSAVTDLSIADGDLEDESSIEMLINKAVSSAEAMNMGFTCAKLLITLEEGKLGELILQQMVTGAKQRYPLNNEELYTLCHVYETLSSLNKEKQHYKLALDQLSKAHECLLDISDDLGEGPKALNSKLLSFIKEKLKIKLSAICITCGDLPMAQSYIDEARMGMEHIRCKPGQNYVLYNQALIRAAQQDYLNSTNYLLKCLDYFELRFGTLHPVVAEISHSLGLLLSDENNEKTSDHAVAEEYLWKALNIRREREAGSMATANSLFQLAFLVQKQGSKTKKKEAVELLQNCLDIHSSRLGNEHEATKAVVYMLNDLHISVQLGQFEFGAAKPVDSRSRNYPFSQLTMHEEALVEYNQSVARKQRPPSSSQSMRSLVVRPQSAFNIDKPRTESRLQMSLVRRPKTAPTTLQRPRSAQVNKIVADNRLADGDINKHISDIEKVVESEMSSVASSPRTYRSCSPDPYNASRASNYSSKPIVLEKYYPSDRYNSGRGEIGGERIDSPTVKVHKCHNIGAHSIHERLCTTTLGPNSTVLSVMGYTRPMTKMEPMHKAAWYHFPNHYTTYQKPHINPRVYAQRKQRLMQQRSQSAPIRSRYLQDHTNAIKLIAQHESARSLV